MNQQLVHACDRISKLLHMIVAIWVLHHAVFKVWLATFNHACLCMVWYNKLLGRNTSPESRGKIKHQFQKQFSLIPTSGISWGSTCAIWKDANSTCSYRFCTCKQTVIHADWASTSIYTHAYDETKAPSFPACWPAYIAPTIAFAHKGHHPPFLTHKALSQISQREIEDGRVVEVHDGLGAATAAVVGPARRRRRRPPEPGPRRLPGRVRRAAAHRAPPQLRRGGGRLQFPDGPPVRELRWRRGLLPPAVPRRARGGRAHWAGLLWRHLRRPSALEVQVQVQVQVIVGGQLRRVPLRRLLPAGSHRRQPRRRHALLVHI